VPLLCIAARLLPTDDPTLHDHIEYAGLQRRGTPG
jgi:hypothetical protein